MEKLSEHFTLDEMLHSNTAEKYNIDNTKITPIILFSLKYLCKHILEPTRRAMNESIIISSGYRCVELNTKVGGATKSQHLRGEAADIYIKNVDYCNRLCNILNKNEYVDQLLLENKGSKVWVHVSCSPLRTPRHNINFSYKL